MTVCISKKVWMIIAYYCGSNSPPLDPDIVTEYNDKMISAHSEEEALNMLWDEIGERYSITEDSNYALFRVFEVGPAYLRLSDRYDDMGNVLGVHKNLLMRLSKQLDKTQHDGIGNYLHFSDRRLEITSRNYNNPCINDEMDLILANA